MLEFWLENDVAIVTAVATIGAAILLGEAAMKMLEDGADSITIMLTTCITLSLFVLIFYAFMELLMMIIYTAM